MEATLQQCSKCGVQLRLPADDEASIFKCPKCGERIRVAASGETELERSLRLREKADRIIRTHVIWSVGAGFMPVPLLDIAAVTGIQLASYRRPPASPHQHVPDPERERRLQGQRDPRL